MNINPGELNKKIQIISITTTKDADGFPIQAETVERECYAKFSRTSGSEIIASNADFGVINARFLVRYTNIPITRKMTVRYNSKDYEIKFVNEYEDSHEYTEIWGEEKGLD